MPRTFTTFLHASWPEKKGRGEKKKLWLTMKERGGDDRNSPPPTRSPWREKLVRPTIGGKGEKKKKDE